MAQFITIVKDGSRLLTKLNVDKIISYEPEVIGSGSVILLEGNIEIKTRISPTSLDKLIQGEIWEKIDSEKDLHPAGL